jgi:hypothetical protein
MSTTEEKKVPTKDEVLAFYKEQIEVAEVRKQLAEIACLTAEFEARRAEAVAKQAHWSAPDKGKPASGIVEHTITQEDMDNNPELAAQGIKVGDVIGLTDQPEDAPKERQLKKS